ncbi:MAG: type II pantothenate kinase [Bacteroides sp.]|nr:type II pantothenate kinase [Bacteroides sp.]
MGMTIGIDVGGSTTKIIGVDKEGIKHPMIVRAEDPVTSLFGAFGKYIYDNGINLSDIERVMLTGVGSAYVNQPLYGLPTHHTDEFRANGLGAHYGSQLKDIIVVSMGTGTSFVKVEGEKIEHIGGIGIGGGTIQGLSRLLLKTHDIHQVVEMAQKGAIENIDLQIKDICNSPLPGLPLDATASTFGKASANAFMEDVAAGIIHMVLQSIGQSVILAALNSHIKDFVLIGNLAKLPQCKEIFPIMEEMYQCHFHIPEYAEFRTALGAALLNFAR